jgi:hypothetical protein
MYTRRLCLSLLLVAALTCAQDGNVAVQVTGAVKQVVLPLAELDPAFSDNQILLQRTESRCLALRAGSALSSRRTNRERGQYEY